MGSRYRIPAGRHRVEDLVRRSRFITTVDHAPTVEAARAFIEAIRAEFPDATHHCWAYVVGPPGSTAQVGMSDGGEPHGTAGRPMLHVLLHSGVGDIVAVVTRYFGGVKLGRGGLTRAYSGGVQHALAGLPVVEKVEQIPLEVTVDYAYVTPLQRLWPEHQVQLLEEHYGAEVRYRVQVPVDRLDALTRAITELTHGRAHIRPETASG